MKNKETLGVLQQKGYTCAICRHVVDGGESGYVRICKTCQEKMNRAPRRESAASDEQYSLNLG